MASNDNNLIWLDLEMTGLEPAHDVILEIAIIITDSHLNTLAQGPIFAINPGRFRNFQFWKLFFKGIHNYSS